MFRAEFEEQPETNESVDSAAVKLEKAEQAS